jgi:hypothetical protein
MSVCNQILLQKKIDVQNDNHSIKSLKWFTYQSLRNDIDICHVCTGGGVTIKNNVNCSKSMDLLNLQVKNVNFMDTVVVDAKHVMVM